MASPPTTNEFKKVPIPADLAQHHINLSDNARTVLEKRYLRRGDSGKPVETIQEMFWRVAYHVALAEKELGGDDAQVEAWARRFFDLLTDLNFFPNSPTFTGAGTPLGQLAACFVLAIEDDMGRTGSGIFETLRHAALIQQTGGGNGFSFSRLRPKGALVKSSSGTATGPIGFLRVYDQAFGEIAQGGSRRGANMAVLRVDHPDVRDFIKCKSEEGNIANFNISVGITDAFMQAVADDTTYDLINPQNGEVWETVRAREIFDMIVEYAHHNGEPGVLFLDAANRENPVPHLYELESTNPCVTGDTLIATPNGWLRADEIGVGDEISTVLGTGTVATVEINENMPVFLLTLSDGSTVKATASHQFHVREHESQIFTPRRLDDLNVGDWVRVFKGHVPNNPVPQHVLATSDRDYGFLLGLELAENAAIGEVQEEWEAIRDAAYAQIGAALPIGTTADMQSSPFASVITPDNTLPLELVNSNREFLAGFIDGLFSSAASIDEAETVLRFHTNHAALAQQLRRILLMFGIHGRVENAADGITVDIVGESFGRFFEQFTLSNPAQQYRLEEVALRTNFTGGNWAAQVVSVEFAGVETVYDLYEPRSDTWITEGYVSRGCGEQFLGPFENCCLGSVNLAQHLHDDGGVNWEKLAESVSFSTRFLDDVVTSNAYVPAIPQLREAAERVRRIGLGIMGLADMMYAAGVRYGSVEGQEFASQVMEFVRYHAMKTSIELAEERGPFLGINGSRYDPKDLKWTAPVSLIKHTTNWGRPKVDWNVIRDGLLKHGIRNGAQTTIAPTGTISTVSGIEGYGCEPVFALAYVRYVNSNAGNSSERFMLQYTSPLFERALQETGLSSEEITAIVEQVNVSGSCQDIPEVPDNIRRVFVTAGDISAEEHVRMQAVMQAHVDNAISKTINFPAGTTREEVATAYQLGWNLGCKGMTVYVTGSRDVVVLETAETKQKREGGETVEAPKVTEAPKPVVAEDQPLSLFNEKKKARPHVLAGKTYRILTPAGTTYITINENGYGKGQPFEVFVHTAKAGSEIAAVSEAIGRLVSLVLRQASPISPRDRVKEMVRQLEDIGGGRSLGFGANRVASLPDAVAQILQEYLTETEGVEGGEVLYTALNDAQLPLVLEVGQGQVPTAIGDLCPECGQATLIREEGCLHCYTCGYSEC